MAGGTGVLTRDGVDVRVFNNDNRAYKAVFY